MEINGKMIQSQSVMINGKSQLQDVKIPQSLAKGNYIIKVM
jgi:hypothetical protein